jgi:hypothetical protein
MSGQFVDLQHATDFEAAICFRAQIMARNWPTAERALLG